MAMHAARTFPMRDEKSVGARTIDDFGDQWTAFRDNLGYDVSIEMLQDHLGPLLDVGAFRGQVVGDIGSGAGRIVRMLADAGAAKIHAFEPSDAYDVLCDNVRDLGDQVECHRLTGDAIPPLDLDAIVSIGVVHHIPDPAPVMAAAFAALRPGGRIFLWLYGFEGNEGYLRVILPLRWITTRMPHSALAFLCRCVDRALDVYIAAARRAPVPLRDYVLNVFARLERETRVAVIYDQLNPAYARYYRKQEAEQLLADAGFEQIELFHRRGYSWSVTGVRPPAMRQ
jgi:SAM-dependent methyltransferase